MPFHDLAFYVCLALIIGLSLGAILTPAAAPLFYLSVFILGLFFLLLAILEQNRRLLILFFCLLLAVPAYGYALWRGSAAAAYRPPLGYHRQLAGVVSASPAVGLKHQLLSVKLASPYQGEIFVYADVYADLRFGDQLLLTGTLRELRSGRLALSWPEITVSERRDHLFRSRLYALKSRIIQEFKNVLPAAPAALLSGLTLGDRAGFSPEFKNALSRSGTTHLVALSGYNITIITAAVALLLNYFLSRRLTFFISLLAIIVFVVMVGPEPSLVRAALMGAIALLSVIAGRLYSARNAIAVSAAVMLFITPAAAADIGFQLSFAALLGLVYLLPAVEPFFFSENEVSFLNWRRHLITTAAAQFMTLPLILYHFHFFSFWSLLSNLLILEFVPYAMLLGFLIGLAGLLSSVFSVFSLLFSYPVRLLLNYQLWVIDFFAGFDSLSVNFTPSLSLIILYYIAIAVFISRRLSPPSSTFQ